MTYKKKPKTGWVYGVEYKAKSGKKKTYVGKTSNVTKRMKQHGVKK
jgi:predicted GIY-YIG superfamily endonuclease